MLKNKEFRKPALIMMIITFFQFYLFIATNEMIGVLMPVYMLNYGWSNSSITLPITIGSYVAIVVSLALATIAIKKSAKAVLGIVAFIMGAAILGIAWSNSYVVYFICMLIIKSVNTFPAIGVAMLCTAWFIKYRGTSMGIVTIGGPVASASFSALATIGMESASLGIAFTVFAVFAFLIGALTIILVKDRPEILNLNPDGALQAVQPEMRMDGGRQTTLKEVLKNPRSWLLIFGVGIWMMIMYGCSAFFITNMIMSGTDSAVYLTCLSAGAIGGIFLSYLFGWLDDKIGTVKASLILCIPLAFTIIGNLFITKNNILLIVMIAIGQAAISGGATNLRPSLVGYIYGRKNFNSVNRYMDPIQQIFIAICIPLMSLSIDLSGSLKPIYITMLPLVVISFILIMIIGRKPDYDRGAAGGKAPEENLG